MSTVRTAKGPSLFACHMFEFFGVSGRHTAFTLWTAPD